MSSPVPTNELDQAILALQRSRAAFPDLCRCVGQGELFLLIRYQPDLVDAAVELKNGAPFPFARIQTDRGESVLAYTSVERAQEGLAKGQVPDMQFVIGSMPARQALEVIGKMNFSMTLNQGCATGQVVLPPDLLRDLADGTALKPLPPSGQVENITLKIMDPANYPTGVVQDAFELFRRHAAFRAAWIFTRSDTPEAYYMIVVMQPRDAALFHDFNLVAAAAAGKQHPVHAQLADENDAGQIAVLFNAGRPFYQAVDYPSPPGPKPVPEENP
jgi:hypothetical protein